MILCDAGVLLCLVDRSQPQHKAYRNTILRLTSPLITTWSCLTEAMYLALHRGGWNMQKQLGQLLLDKLLTLYEIQENDYDRLLKLMEQYRDRPRSFSSVYTENRLDPLIILWLSTRWLHLSKELSFLVLAGKPTSGC